MMWWCSRLRQERDAAQAQWQAAQEALHLAQAVFASVQAVLVANPKGVIERVNDAFTALTGYSSAEVLGKTPWLLRSGHHDEAFYAAMCQSVSATGSWEGEIWGRHKSGAVFPKWMKISAVHNAQGQLTHLIATYVDICQGGDETACQVGPLVERLRQALAQPYDLGDGSWRCTASLGVVAFSPARMPAGRAEAAPALVQQAELAMHEAKAQGGDGLHFYDPQLEQVARARVQTERDLDAALAQQ